MNSAQRLRQLVAAFKGSARRQSLGSKVDIALEGRGAIYAALLDRSDATRIQRCRGRTGVAPAWQVSRIIFLARFLGLCWPAVVCRKRTKVCCSWGGRRPVWLRTCTNAKHSVDNFSCLNVYPQNMHVESFSVSFTLTCRGMPPS